MLLAAHLAPRRFQPTRAARIAPDVGFAHLPLTLDFNPRAPRGARRMSSFTTIVLISISIHALREERDSKKTQNRRAFFVINIEYYESFR